MSMNMEWASIVVKVLILIILIFIFFQLKDIAHLLENIVLQGNLGEGLILPFNLKFLNIV